MASAKKETRPPSITTTDVVVFGAGPIGAALATTMARQGRRVTLIERDWTERVTIVGELIQPGGVATLRKLGLDGCLDGIDASPVYGYTIFKPTGENIRLPYPEIEVDGKKSTPHGYSFHHGRMVMGLRRIAKNERLVDCVQGTVTGLLEDESGDRVIGVKYKADGEIRHVHAQMTFICDGHFSNFRRRLVTEKTAQSDHFVGLILRDLDLPFPNHGHVVLADPGPVLMYPVDTTGEVRMLVSIPNPLPSNRKGDLTRFLQEHVAPQLPDVVRVSMLNTLEKDKPRSMPCDALHPQPFFRKGAILLGDSFNMRHPLTGGAMTVGWNDVYHLSRALSNVRDLTDHDLVVPALEQFYIDRRPLAATVNILAAALATLFTAQDKALVPMRDACYDYLGMGGILQRHPVAMLAATMPSPLTLFSHFFAVCFYGMFRLNFPVPSPWSLVSSIKVLVTAARIFFPLMWREHLFAVNYPVLHFPPPIAAQKRALAEKRAAAKQALANDAKL